jgi:hypothetical protein
MEGTVAGHSSEALVPDERRVADGNAYAAIAGIGREEVVERKIAPPNPKLVNQQGTDTLVN